jgi:hypothetical protein
MEIKAWTVEGWNYDRSFNIGYYTTKELAEEALRFFRECKPSDYGYAIGLDLDPTDKVTEVIIVINETFNRKEWE